MTAPKTDFKYADGTPKKLRRSVRFSAAVAQTRGRKYRVRSAVGVRTASKPA
jgi:hypothetical protein